VVALGFCDPVASSAWPAATTLQHSKCQITLLTRFFAFFINSEGCAAAVKRILGKIDGVYYVFEKLRILLLR